MLMEIDEQVFKAADEIASACKLGMAINTHSLPMEADDKILVLSLASGDIAISFVDALVKQHGDRGRVENIDAPVRHLILEALKPLIDKYLELTAYVDEQKTKH